MISFLDFSKYASPSISPWQHLTHTIYPQERIICLNGEVDESMSASIVAQLLFLEADNPKKPIHLYINSPGGSVTAGTQIPMSDEAILKAIALSNEVNPPC